MWRCLKMFNVRLCAQGLQALCQLLGPRCSIRVLDLSGNALTNVGVVMLVNQLQRSPLMASLDLSKNATDAGVSCDV